MVEELLDRMTLEEQVSLLAGEGFWTTQAIERLSIPSIKLSDGPNGARGGGGFTNGVRSACFPAGIALGASWNPEAVRLVGKALAQEAKTKGASVLLAPTVNLHRTGLNGRNFECFSEDPRLTADLAVAFIEGVQSEKIAATVKHFVGNESEIERTSISSDIDERSLRELYLVPFEAAVKKAGVRAVMTGYNRLNGIFCSESEELLTRILKKEWNFTGIAMSDWFGSHSTEPTLQAGLDLEMPGPTRHRGDKVLAALSEGRLAPETVRAAAGRLLALIEWVGAIEQSRSHEERAEDRPEHRALIREMGAEGTVLLKNSGILPLERAGLERVAVVGPNADVARIMGGGSAQINAHYRVSPLDALRAALPEAEIVHELGARNNRLVDLFEEAVVVEFFRGQDCSGPVVHAITEPSSEIFWLDMPHAELDPENFSARLSIRFTPVLNGDYVFGLTSAGFARLYVNGLELIDGDMDWTAGENFFGLGNSERRASITLKAGESYYIRVDYRNPPPGGAMSFRALRFGAMPPIAADSVERAAEAARLADVALLFVGRNGEWDAEGLDLPNMRLPGRQEELIRSVAAANPRTVVVLQTGGPVEMPWLDCVAAVIQSWYPGQEAGNAIADVLTGARDPGGRLPQTFPRRLIDMPMMADEDGSYPGKNGHVRYAEGLSVGYRHFNGASISPLFAFGFGLSYTQFQWSPPQIVSGDINDGDLILQVDVRNIGDRRGSDVVQLYVEPIESSVRRPRKELRGFGKVHLGPGETGTLRFSITQRDLSFYDVGTGRFRALAGDYNVVFASDAESERSRVELHLSRAWQAPVHERGR